MLNRPLDGETAQAITSIFTEVVIAPGASAEAREIFAAKKNLRLLLVDALPDPTRSGTMLKQVWGGYLAQDRCGETRKIQRDCLCQGRGDRWHWCRPDEPR